MGSKVLCLLTGTLWRLHGACILSPDVPRLGPDLAVRRAADEVEAKRREIQRLLASEAPKLAFVQKRTAYIKSEVEMELSKSFEGRQVHVIGEINNVLIS